MATWSNLVLERTNAIHEQMAGLLRLAKKFGDNGSEELAGALKTYQKELDKLYSEDMPLAKLKDNSDILIRATGEAARHDNPYLRAINWLSSHVSTQMNAITKAVLPLNDTDATQAAKKLNWIFNGYAPGSVIMGFSLEHTKSATLFTKEDNDIFSVISASAQGIATVPSFIEHGVIGQGLYEVISDPLVRDVALMAALHLSPTGQIGIDQIEISNRNGFNGVLNKQNKRIIKSALTTPEKRKTLTGTFTGNIRAADLDKGRVILRNLDSSDIFAIRCVISERMDIDNMFNKRVTVKGFYEPSRDGKPRLLYIETIEPARELKTESLF
jgi:hypothetical protein